MMDVTHNFSISEYQRVLHSIRGNHHFIQLFDLSTLLFFVDGSHILLFLLPVFNQTDIVYISLRVAFQKAVMVVFKR